MQNLKLDKINLRKFGITMGIVFFMITIFMVFGHKHNTLPALVISATFFISAFFIPFSLKYIYILWMRLAFLLSWINTRLILFIMFYFVFTPIGLMTKLFGFDLLDRKIDKNRGSYWSKKEDVYNDMSYEKQF